MLKGGQNAKNAPVGNFKTREDRNCKSAAVGLSTLLNMMMMTLPISAICIEQMQELPSWTV